MDKSWTKSQDDAIRAGGGPLLVSAAAGSGKTAVLVERVIRMLCDEFEPIDADRLLIVTFTNAAAAEMKQRISARLAEAARNNPSDMRLMRQQSLLARASIGTIHSFCLDLIRRNFQHLPIAQDFSLAEEGELEILRQDAAREVLERFYSESADSRFLELVELLSSGRSDGKVIETMLRLYDFARSHPFFERWLDKTRALYRSVLSVEETLWGKSLLRHAADTLDYCIEMACVATDIMRKPENAAAYTAYGSAFSSDIAQLRQVRKTLDGGNWDEVVAALRGVAFERLSALRGNEAVKEYLKGMRDRVRDLVKELAEKTFDGTRADFASDMADLEPKVAVLFELTREFSVAYAERKRDKKRLDFSDLEHLALSLLVRPDEKGGCIRTELALELAAGFDRILVDEYQDVNEVQDLIFTSVSDSQRNLFLVGDAKQSIYSFRLATPEIFLERKAGSCDYQSDGHNPFPAKISLDINFRSRGGVIGAVNYLFGLLMSERLGDIDYAGDELLRCGARYPYFEREQPAFLLLDTARYQGGEDAAVLEANMVAGRIAAMISENYPVAGDDGLRPARPGDFCVLLRSKKHLGTYVKALEQAGLPVWAQNTDGFLSRREVGMVLSLLEALDNPLRDLSLAAAMISPLFGFSETEIASVRLAGRDIPFFRALGVVAENTDTLPLTMRCREFIALFYELRARAATLPVDRLLLEIYARTDALAIAEAMDFGENRRANLLLLMEYAGTYHDLGYKQLNGFVGFLDRLRERGGDLAGAGISGESMGAVRVMSVHHSKGLEFPVVILADTARKFNRNDLRQNTQLHSKFGFACLRRDDATLKQYATVPMQAIRLESGRSRLGEELRILYVALTRAREKLIITACTGSTLRRRLGALGAVDAAKGKLNPRALEEASSPADWIMAALLRHPCGAPLRDAGGISEIPIIENDTPWDVEILDPPEEEAAEPAAETPRAAKPDLEFLRLLNERAVWSYPYEAQTRIPAKLAVSAAAKGADEAVVRRFNARPKFMSESALTATEQGNAMHKFMQFADYARARENLTEEIRRMAEQRFLSAAEAESLSLRRLGNFFNGPLAARIFASDMVWRELRFMGECGGDVLGDILEGMDDTSSVALQGVADCVFMEDGKAVIVDYKTDRVTGPEELIRRYAGQLRLYRHILADALPAPVGECLLYSFALGREIPVE